MNRKKILITFILVAVILLAIISLYSTYATSTGLNVNNDTYTFTLKNSPKEVSLAPNESKTVIYQIKNTSNGTVKYGIAFATTVPLGESDDFTVKVYDNSADPVSGLIARGENKFVKLYVKNNSTSENTTISLSAVLGYENGGNLVTPRFTSLVTEVYYSGVNGYIANLFTKTGTVTSNSIVHDIDATHSLIKDPKGNIRYYGASPNNYIKFNCDTYPDTNCETWRIIGVVDGKLKLIRNEQIGTYSSDTSISDINSGYGINEWSQADLMKLLNPGYESESVGGSLYYNSSNNGTCYSGRNNTTKSCNFSPTSTTPGIKNESTRNKIAEIIYYTGGWNSYSIYTNAILDKERETTVITSPEDGITRTTTWLGKIAVPYPSDYGYATDLSLCTGKNLHQYNDSTCTSNNWMKNIITNNGSNGGWLLTPRSSTAYSVWIVLSSGAEDNYYASSTYGVTPVLSLDSEQIIVSGDGSEGNAYTLSA